LTILFS